MKRELTTENTEVVFGMDDVIVQKFIADIPAGRTIDFTGYDVDTKIIAGHPIIKGVANGATVYRPFPITKTTTEGVTTVSYGTLPAGFAVVGVLYRTITKANPQGSILIDAVINEVAAQNAGLPAYTSAQKTALSNIKFVQDEEA